MIVGTQDIHALLIEDLLGCNVPTEETYNSLNVLLKVMENIKNNPNQTKFRSLKINNQAISRMLSLQGAFQLLSSCNFVQSGQNMLQYQYSQESYDIIMKILRMLGPRVRTMEIVNKIQPHILKMVNERKAKMEAEKEYKRKVIRQIQSDRQEYKLAHKK